MERVRKPAEDWEDATLILKTPAQGTAKAGEPVKIPVEAPEEAVEKVAEEAVGINFMNQST